jgi:hypothetical protein
MGNRAGFIDSLVNTSFLRVPNWRRKRTGQGRVHPMAGRFAEPRVLPKLSRNINRINFDGSPPFCFIASTMEDTMVRTAKGHGELVADPAAQGARLCKSQVMGVGRPASAQQARL